MQLERGVDAVIEFIVLLPFAILMIPLFIWDEIDEIRDKRELRRRKYVNYSESPNPQSLSWRHLNI